MKALHLGLCMAFLLPASLLMTPAQAQELSLGDCYRLAEQNYPLVRQHELIARTASYTIDNIRKGYLPQFYVNGQASYQSAVTEIPFKVPGFDIPTISKDQYKLSGELDQVVYDGGVMKRQKQLQQASEAMEQGQLEADLYQLRERINQLFFGILLIDEQVKENDLVMADIRLGLNKVLASISNGTAFKSNADVLRAELLKDDQNNIELRAGRKAYADMLGFFTGKTVDEGTVLTKPGRLDGAPSGMSGQPVPPSPDIHRPELSVYALQDKSLDIQDKLLKANALPKLGLFLQGGWGRPGLDMLDNNFTGFYIGGIRLTWSPSAYYTLKKQHALIGIDRQNVAVQRETFLFNTHLTIKQQDGAIDQYRQLLASDDEIVALRDKIKNTSLAQLENGAIDSNDYLREVNAEDQARQGKIVHTIQLLMSQYNQRTTTGNQL